MVAAGVLERRMFRTEPMCDGIASDKLYATLLIEKALGPVTASWARIRLGRVADRNVSS